MLTAVEAVHPASMTQAQQPPGITRSALSMTTASAYVPGKIRSVSPGPAAEPEGDGSRWRREVEDEVGPVGDDAGFHRDVAVRDADVRRRRPADLEHERVPGCRLRVRQRRGEGEHALAPHEERDAGERGGDGHVASAPVDAGAPPVPPLARRELDAAPAALAS